MSIVKPTRPPHYNNTNNPLSFDEAYQHILENPNLEYETTGNKAPFIAIATITTKGVHKGEEVIIFKDKEGNKKEKGRAYPCCWGHNCNCNRTYIDCYTQAITK